MAASSCRRKRATRSKGKAGLKHVKPIGDIGHEAVAIKQGTTRAAGVDNHRRGDLGEVFELFGLVGRDQNEIGREGGNGFDVEVSAFLFRGLGVRLCVADFWRGWVEANLLSVRR